MKIFFSPPRLNLPKKKKKPEREDEEQDVSPKNDNSSEQLDVDGDSSSEVSSEINFNFEYAQMEVTMKALGSNGKQVFSTLLSLLKLVSVLYGVCVCFALKNCGKFYLAFIVPSLLTLLSLIQFIRLET